MSTATATPVKEEKKQAPAAPKAEPPKESKPDEGKASQKPEPVKAEPTKPETASKGAVACPYRDGETVELPIDSIVPDPDQPRHDWMETPDQEDKTELDRLAMTVRTLGIIEDISVRPVGDGKFMIIAGERRWRAAKIVGIQKAKCKMRTTLSADDVFETQMVENLHRRGISAVDEAHGYKRLMERKKLNASQLAARLGVSNASVTYKLSLLGLTPELQKLVHKGKLSPTDGRFVAQSINKIEGPNKEEHRKEVMDRVANTVKQQTETGARKMTSKAVQALAKQEVAKQEEKRATPVPVPTKASAPAVNVQPAKKVEPEKPKNPSPQEKKQRAEFVKAVERVRAAFKKFEPIAQDAAKLSRFSQVLCLLDPRVDEFLFSAGKTLAKIYEQVGVQKKLLSVYGGK